MPASSQRRCNIPEGIQHRFAIGLDPKSVGKRRGLGPRLQVFPRRFHHGIPDRHPPLTAPFTHDRDAAIVQVHIAQGKVGHFRPFVAVCIDPDRRRATEMGLLRDYHSVLLECGVSGYDFDGCLLDYRRSLLFTLTSVVIAIPLVDVSSERGQRLVKAMLDRLDSALTDHNVGELMPG